jgi:large subunit ribosomal protein L19
MNLIAQIEAEQIAARQDIPDFKAGDTIRVGYKVTEGTRSRVQAYEGVCIGRNGGGGIGASFTVRKISFGEGVERVFPLYSTNIDSDRGGAPRQGAPRQALLPARRAAASRPGSPRRPTTAPGRGRRSLRSGSDESRYPPRLPHHRRQDDRRHRGADEIHLGQGRRHAVARHRPLGASGLDRRHTRLMDTGGRVSKFKNKYAGLGF